MASASSIHNDILRVLGEHPLLSRRQIELALGRPERTVRQALHELKTRSWVWHTNARQPWLHARRLYALTNAGVQVLARGANVPFAEYCARIGFSTARQDRLVLTMERVFQLRTFFLWLASANHTATWPWRAVAWDVEVTKFFTAQGRAVWIPFDGAALMQRASGRNEAESKEKAWAFIVVEFDLGRVAVASERERLQRLVAAQDDPRYWGKEYAFPVLVIIAQNEWRLQEYYNLLRSAALARQLPMPRAYLTTFDALLSFRRDPTSAMWYSTISGRRTSFLADTAGLCAPFPNQVPWRKMPLHQTGQIEDPKSKIENAMTNPTEAKSESAHAFAQIALNLTPLEKRLVDKIAAHPLVTRQDLVLLLQASLRRVRPALTKLQTFELIQAHTGRYLIARKGQQYLAHTAGFGNAVRRYARARGWGKPQGFDELLRHAAHTQAENKFFLHLASIARARGHSLIWLSELESRLYYEAGQRRHSFLPDGRGSYMAGDARYEFAVEIDRSRVSQARLQRKLAEYEACVSSNVLRSEGVELLRLLVVTRSWERAETWRRAAQSVRAQLPILITTFDRLDASHADARIWLRGDLPSSEPAATSPKVYCFGCFGALS